jgi:ABC-type multidrug transport system fused ATPase/permease subunit
MVRGYLGVLTPQRRLAFSSLALFAASSASEALALGMLVPLLESTSAGSGGNVFTTLLEDLGFRGRGVTWAAAGALALFSIFAAVTRFGGNVAIFAVRSRIEAYVRTDFTDRLLDMSWSSFLMLHFGDIANSLMNESSQVGSGVQSFLTAACSTAATLVFAILALLLSPELTLVVIGFAFMGLVVLRPMGRHAESHTRGFTEATTAVARRIADVLGNLKFFRSTGSYRREQFAEGYEAYAASFQRTLVSPFLVALIYEVSALVFMTALLVLSLIGKAAVPATTVVFIAIFYRLSPRINILQSALVSLSLQYPWLTRWQERRAAAVAHRAQSTGTLQPTFTRAIAAEELSFTFHHGSAEVLQGISWKLRPGETVAFVGESGAGKTTTLDLVTGLLSPTAGRITVDGVSLMELDLDAWRRQIGLVLQDSPLFHATVRENVVGDRDADDELVWRCLASAHAKNFVEELPEQLDTVIGERGGRLSGGERQRIGLARALYRQPRLLILDEATSQLDSVSENIVLDALGELRGRVSMMIVAHRLVTVEMADRIYVLEGGRIMQTGSWNELLADSDGLFARMAARQGLAVSPV